MITSINRRNCCKPKISLRLIRSNLIKATTDVDVPSILLWLLSHPSTCGCQVYIQICVALTHRIHFTSDVPRNRNSTRSSVVVRSKKSVKFPEICVPITEIFTLILFWPNGEHSCRCARDLLCLKGFALRWGLAYCNSDLRQIFTISEWTTSSYGRRPIDSSMEEKPSARSFQFWWLRIRHHKHFYIRSIFSGVQLSHGQLPSLVL